MTRRSAFAAVLGGIVASLLSKPKTKEIPPEVLEYWWQTHVLGQRPISKDELIELGKRPPYHRFDFFPSEVSHA